MKKSLMSLAVAGFAILSLTACGGTSSTGGGNTPATTGGGVDNPTLSLIVSGPAEHRDFILQQCAALKKDTTSGFANVTFTYSVIGEDAIDSSDRGGPNDWSASTAPDVYAMASDKGITLLGKGAIAEIPSAYRTNISSQMNADALEIATVGSKVYAYPYASDNGYFLYYNKDAFSGTDSEAYKTIEGISAVAAKKSMHYGYNLDVQYYSIGALFTFGADYEVTVGNSNAITAINADFDGTKGQDAVKAIAQVYKDTNRNSDQKAPEAAASTDLVAVIDGAWNYKSYSETLGEKLGMAAMPTVTIGTNPDQKTGRIGAFMGYKCYGVNPQKTGNDRLALSHKLANYLISKPVQLARFNSLHVTPTNEELLADNSVNSDPLVKVILEQRPHSHTQGVVPGGIWSAPDGLIGSLQPGAAEPYDPTKVTNYATAINNAIKAIS